MRFSLVPYSHRRHQIIAFYESGNFAVRERLAAFVFDFCAKRLAEGDGVDDVEPVRSAS